MMAFLLCSRIVVVVVSVKCCYHSMTGVAVEEKFEIVVAVVKLVEVTD